MKSADVGPCPPANQSPHFDRWSSIYKNSDRPEPWPPSRKYGLTHDFRMSREAGHEETGFQTREDESDQRTEDERCARRSYAENEFIHEQRHHSALGVVRDCQGKVQTVQSVLQGWQSAG